MLASDRNAKGEALKQLTYLASPVEAPRTTEYAARLANHAHHASWSPKWAPHYGAVSSGRRPQHIRWVAADPGGRDAEDTGGVPLGRPTERRAARRRTHVRWGSSPKPATWSCSVRPAPARTHLTTGLGLPAALPDHRVLFTTTADWVTRLADAHRAGRLPGVSRLRPYA
jgi:hypothetical protein